ncbi:MAG: DNA mismatch repair protein MutS [Gammaproteobacteria bacterium]|nr:DNA mismatch repair protein MutS [Gammaproteobacteria bacterium]
MVDGREEYHLEALFYSPLTTVAPVLYRHETLQDLEKREVRSCVEDFSERMQEVRTHLIRAAKLRHKYETERWFLDAAEAYVTAVNTLKEELMLCELDSRALAGLREYLETYAHSSDFSTFAVETQKMRDNLASVAYRVHIRGSRVEVGAYDGEPDYTPEVERTFAKFRQGDVDDYTVKYVDRVGMNHIEARILNLVVRLNPAVFSALDDYCVRHETFLDDTIVRFEREVQFYLAYLEFIGRFKAAGLSFCYPQVSSGSKDIYAREAFDVALANTLVSGKQIVCNDFHLEGAERILVVTGANQGGKTTFARMFGQLHYLASLGYPVPGSEARLFLPDQILTHFEREEDVETLQGKLESDLVRIRDILQRATSSSVVILNELFSSTTVKDALVLVAAVMSQIRELDLLGVCVTFLDEIASLGESTVSMVGMVDSEDPSVRTYKVVRRPADGRAYAMALAAKYGLTYPQLRERVTS